MSPRSHRRFPLTPKSASLLLGLAFSILWASAFSAGKVALADCPPLTLLAIRFLAAGCLLAGFMVVTGRWVAVHGRTLVSLLILGLFNHALYLGLSYSAMTMVPSGLTALLISSNPVLVCALAALFLGEPMTHRKGLGLVLGVLGVGLVVRTRLSGGADLVGVLLVLGALASLTVGTLLYKKMPQTVSMAQAIALQLLSGGVVIGAVASISESPLTVNLSPSFFGALLYLIGPVSIGSYALWFSLLERGSASAASVWHFLVPPIGLFLGWLILGEPLDPTDLMGALPVALAIALVTGGRDAAPRVADDANLQPSTPPQSCEMVTLTSRGGAK